VAAGERVGGTAYANVGAGVGVVVGRAGVGVVVGRAGVGVVASAVAVDCSSQPESGSAVTSPVYLFTCENIFLLFWFFDPGGLQQVDEHQFYFFFPSQIAIPLCGF